ncbi:MAG: LPS export ABC transporter ATP-binding protein [Desulfobacula sp.]|jgi:lipopolysaccharide export system ATP-binding protein|uniref:LPS export ABC transporter ATP-binding protein n=1 Tax=Desulfobacula sp. TaxID=2593537 RepID=UPI001DE7A41A|nr:LPS export ABC transporter ATP-binding protein [Desulfobacula sp.]MBT3485868.1 LPS export ABC transporter ATP-binding protein [Desulfobacula sp.]MBT3805471.1 LPS export ABC transporter ATP-binding protein [Desulfobacula sp.]MBT4199582.1 LPS export ABC transporter ATP-binding protein [Desulfobacula sp.]MBT4506901.1 LPS export ABC transporter ATP-binding protein [Desulfobacula sp.]
MTQLVLKNLVKIYDDKKVVDNVNLTVKQGQVTGLLGPNGAGKTTTFYMSVGLIKSDGGTVLIDNEDITHHPMYIRARKGIGYLPQESSIFKKLTVQENITAILEVLPQNEFNIKQKAMDLMKELGISNLANQKANSLSGGERRRLEISRVLATGPLFILLDEPFAGIDPLAVIDIQQIIYQLTKKGIGVLISDHNVRETLGVCDNAYIMSQGKVIESGNPDKITSSEIAKKIYLGKNFKL